MIGVLALQGAFLEHIAIFERIGVAAKEVRTPSDLEGCDGLVIPGGESTAIGLIAERSGMLGPLRAWVASRARPTWGTCAGMIMLADRLGGGAKEGGQALLGGVDVEVHRNFFGAQAASFEAPLILQSPEEAPRLASCMRAGAPQKQQQQQGLPSYSYASASTASASTVAAGAAVASAPASAAEATAEAAEAPLAFTGVFIRAPAIMSVGDGVKVLAWVRRRRRDAQVPEGPAAAAAAMHSGAAGGGGGGGGGGTVPAGVSSSSSSDSDSDSDSPVIVAAETGPFLITAFHPELTRHAGWHAYFAGMVGEHKRGGVGGGGVGEGGTAAAAAASGGHGSSYEDFAKRVVPGER